jgi:hypothetical protein
MNSKRINFENEHTGLMWLFLFSMFIVTSFYVFETSRFLGSFYDEIVSLMSNYSFITGLDFDASYAKDISGNYSAKLSSGPISAVGSALGWLISKNLLISRISNFLWLCILLAILIKYTLNKFALQKYTFIIYSFLAIIIHPWWYGTLYSLGEAISTTILFFGFLLFSKNRKISLLLIGTAIIFGKYINVLCFIFFYLFIIYKEKKINRILNDAVLFSVPFIVWFILVAVHHESGLFGWLQDFYKYYISTNQSIEIKSSLNFSIQSLNEKVAFSELQKWNMADFLRVLIMPAMVIFLLFFKNMFVEGKLREVIEPVIFSMLPIYVWFWLSSPTKWIRYSQSFVLLGLLVVGFIMANKRSLKLNEFLYVFVMFSFFLSSNLIFFIFYVFILILFLFRKQINTQLINIYIISFLILSLVNSSYEISLKEKEYPDMNDCVVELNSRSCYTSYIQS